MSGSCRADGHGRGRSGIRVGGVVATSAGIDGPVFPDDEGEEVSEIDAIEYEMLCRAAEECLEHIREMPNTRAATRFFQSGSDVIRVRVSLITQAERDESKAAGDNDER